MKRRVSVCCWIEQQSERAHLVFEVSCMDDPDLRLACVGVLRDKGFKLTKKAFSRDAKFSRFYTASQPVPDWTKEEQVADAVTRLLAKAEGAFTKACAVFREVFAR